MCVSNRQERKGEKSKSCCKTSLINPVYMKEKTCVFKRERIYEKTEETHYQ